jgi:predicted phosphate transport protein (TIGR00153 family)
MPPMPFHALIRWFLPKEDHFYDFLERQATVARDAARVLTSLTTGTDPITVRDRVQDLEHQGDAIVHEMLEALARTFVTPIDREDLQKLSKRLDDILDYTNAAARAIVLFGVEKPTEPMTLLMEKLVQCTEVLTTTLPHLRHHDYNAATDGAKQVAKLEKDGDAVFRDAISRLFHDPAIDAKDILREREVLDDLEKAVNRCEQVADALTVIAVKHA